MGSVCLAPGGKYSTAALVQFTTWKSLPPYHIMLLSYLTQEKWQRIISERTAEYFKKDGHPKLITDNRSSLAHISAECIYNIKQTSTYYRVWERKIIRNCDYK